jgi:hypothetical protein
MNFIKENYRDDMNRELLETVRDFKTYSYE